MQGKSKQVATFSYQLSKYVLIVAGTFFLGLGLIGIFLPLLPTTPFLLLAAACYAKSSQKFYTWMLSNKYFGTYIKNYREGKGIPFQIKFLSISFLWIAILFSAFIIVSNLYVRIILIVIAIAVTLHIFTIQTLHQ
jgi:uncharacterized membrane protein YbaN (DUF454 family)